MSVLLNFELFYNLLFNKLDSFDSYEKSIIMK